MGQDWPDEDRWMWTNNREWRIKRKQLSLPFEYSKNFFWTNSWVVESNHRLQSGKLDFLCSSWKQQLKVLQTKSWKTFENGCESRICLFNSANHQPLLRTVFSRKSLNWEKTLAFLVQIRESWIRKTRKNTKFTKDTSREVYKVWKIKFGTSGVRGSRSCFGIILCSPLRMHWSSTLTESVIKYFAYNLQFNSIQFHLISFVKHKLNYVTRILLFHATQEKHSWSSCNPWQKVWDSAWLPLDIY